jgi:hypothetical protein
MELMEILRVEMVCNGVGISSVKPSGSTTAVPVSV